MGKIAAQKDFVAGDGVANDGFGHGTHVTGVAAALTNNGRGVAGGCPGCRLLMVKVIGSDGTTTDSILIAGIDCSVNNGADVINPSLAGLLAAEGKTATEIRQRTQSTATDLGAAGDDPRYGHARIDAYEAVP